MHKVTGKTIDRLIDEKILVQYDLKNTFWPHNVYLPYPYSNGYTRFNLSSTLADATNYNPSWANAAGIMISNIYDLNNYIKLLGEGSFYSSAMHTERMKSAAGSNGLYGFALYKPEDKMLGHSGMIYGYNTWAYYLPSKEMSIIISVNFCVGDGSTPAESIAEKILPIVAPELFLSKKSIFILESNEILN